MPKIVVSDQNIKYLDSIKTGSETITKCLNRLLNNVRASHETRRQGANRKAEKS